MLLYLAEGDDTVKTYDNLNEKISQLKNDNSHIIKYLDLLKKIEELKNEIIKKIKEIEEYIYLLKNDKEKIMSSEDYKIALDKKIEELRQKRDKKKKFYKMGYFDHLLDMDYEYDKLKAEIEVAEQMGAIFIEKLLFPNKDLICSSDGFWDQYEIRDFDKEIKEYINNLYYENLCCVFGHEFLTYEDGTPKIVFLHDISPQYYYDENIKNAFFKCKHCHKLIPIKSKEINITPKVRKKEN